MKAVFALILSSALILSIVSAQKRNPVNPNFNYPESQLVNKSVSNIPYAGQIYDGYITVNTTTGSKIFYTLFPAGGQYNATTFNNSAPLILWVQGGPGCSDDTGLYLEIGPYTINQVNGSFVPTLQPVTWNDEYNLLFVDSPAGVGYSVWGGEKTNTALEAAHYLQIFLIRFFQVYSSLAKNDFYIFGESYGGHYIPALATTITLNVSQNHINLKGIGVGDGWTDPYYQLTSFNDYAFATGLVDLAHKDGLKGLETIAQNDILAGQFANATNLFDRITNEIVNLNGGGLDIYNFQAYNIPNNLPYDYWLADPAGKATYGVDPNVTYQDCVNDVYTDFFEDIGTSYAINYTYLLTQNNLPNLKILLYSGQNDIICNTLGTQRWLANLDWAGIPLFLASPRTQFNATNGTAIGFYKTYGRLSFSLVYNGGHMLPWNQPESSRIMLEKFITGQF